MLLVAPILFKESIKMDEKLKLLKEINTSLNIILIELGFLTGLAIGWVLLK